MTVAALPPRLERAVSLHVAANLRPLPHPGTSLLLGVHGPPGDGKTYGVQAILTAARVEAILVSGGQLESGVAGEPADIVRTAYVEASHYIKNGHAAALLLNDADAAIGSWGPLTQYTVNTQNVITELMHLADYPTRVEGQDTARVPIILTGNDFTRLYGPLCRLGRMSLCEWTLSDLERAAILHRISQLDHQDCTQLVADYPGRPIAFWSSAVNAVGFSHLERAIEQLGLVAVLRNFVAGRDLDQHNVTVDAALLREAAATLAFQSEPAHLSRQEIG
jgi:hypothetical protein